MPTQRANLTSFCFNDGQEIFACGGWINKYADTNRTDGYSLNDVECFVMERNRWLSMREMREIRFLFILQKKSKLIQIRQRSESEKLEFTN